MRLWTHREFYEQVAFFIRLLENGRLHIRKTLEPNHAKLYLFRLDEGDPRGSRWVGPFHSGSSVVTRSGLIGPEMSSTRRLAITVGRRLKDSSMSCGIWPIPITEVLDERRENKLIRVIRRQTRLLSVTPFELCARTEAHS